MTAVTPKATSVLNYETRGVGAATFNDPITFGGRLRAIISVTDIAAADSDADIWHVAPVYSSWRIDSMPTKCDAITGGTSYELGLYTISAAFAAAALDIDCYATHVDFSTAITSLPVDLKNEALDIALNAQRIWQDPTGGASSDPKTWYYLSYTATTAGSGAGQIVTSIRYVDGS